jgi:hypothetical protein
LRLLIVISLLCPFFLVTIGVLDCCDDKMNNLMESQVLVLVLAFMISVAVLAVCTLAVVTCCRGDLRAKRHQFTSPPNLFQALVMNPKPMEQVVLSYIFDTYHLQTLSSSQLFTVVAH